MSKSTPPLLALLGLVAVAGYQNRNKISEMLTDARQRADSADSSALAEVQSAGFMAEIGKLFGAGRSGGTLSAGLGDLVERFKSTGRQASVDSWVSDKANMPLGVDDLESALGTETLAALAQKTGLSRAELLLRLNRALPEVVNRFTPNGRLPDAVEAGDFS